MSTAVILAARKERDSEIPYPLIPYEDNTCLIDRTLCILRELEYKHIYIVVGYRAEMFAKYSADDVRIIVNANYEFTSSMGSLALLKDIIDEDFLLIEGDTFYEKEVIKQLSLVSRGNCLVMTEESGNGDECFVETQSGFVTKISKDRHRMCRFEGELLGLLRMSEVTFRRILELWEHSENPYLNYEYLLMDVTDAIERPVLQFKNLIWGEVDNQADFKRLVNDTSRRLRIKEDPFDYDNLRSQLATIFPNDDTHNVIIEKMGGMSNKNYRVVISGRMYVLRVPGNGSEGMVNRDNEEFNALEAGKLGVNPQTIYFSAKTGVKLTEYIQNAETLNGATIQRTENMNKIARIYRTIHGAHIRLRNEFNIFKEINKYDSLLSISGAEMYEGWETVRQKVMDIESRLNKLGVNLCPCHNDAVPENFIKAENGTIYLIDWEYSGMNDPVADLAALFLESDFTEESKDYMLNQYFNNRIPENVEEKLLCYQILWDYLWAQWTVIKENKGDDFGSYGINRFNRAVRNLDVLSEKYN